MPPHYIVRKFICPFLSIKPNKIVFDNFGGRGLGDSPMYIAMEILRQELDCDLVWLVRNMKEPMPKGIRKVKFNSIRSIIEICTSKVWIDNVKNGILEDKKKGQYYIQTWHGGGVLLKHVEKAAIDTLTDFDIKITMNDSTKIDLILSDNQIISDDYKENFWLPPACEIFEHGMPCKDGLYRTQDEILSIKNKIIGGKNVGIALYAPTFRDDNTYEGYGINLEQVLNKLERKTKREWVILVRLHPAALKLSNLFSYGSKIINVTNYSNPMDIVVASDMLITDYSSISSDFLILNKPVFILALDLNHYQTHCRKLHPYYFSLPYPFAYSNEELLDAIENFDREKYLEKTEDYKRNFLKPFGDGHASEHVVSRIKQVIGFNGKE